MRHTGRKLHLLFAKRSRTLAGNHDGNEARAKHNQYSEADSQIPPAQLLYGTFERSRAMLHQKLPRLANNPDLEAASDKWARHQDAGPPLRLSGFGPGA